MPAIAFARRQASWAPAFAFLASLLALAAAGGGASAGPTETVVYSFTGGIDGANPFAGLIADRSGNLYGTTNPRRRVECRRGV
jgi:hypothetical protein